MVLALVTNLDRERRPAHLEVVGLIFEQSLRFPDLYQSTKFGPIIFNKVVTSCISIDFGVKPRDRDVCHADVHIVASTDFDRMQVGHFDYVNYSNVLKSHTF